MLLNNISRAQAAEKTLAIYQHAIINQQQFAASVENLYEQIVQYPDKENWVLFCEDSLLFAVGFFALLHAGKKIILPGNFTAVTQQRLALLSDAYLGDQAHSLFEITLSEREASCNLPDIQAEQSCITMFTSGSTGEPKAVVKQLSQIENEIQHLQELWGKELAADALTLATVSHQHIYGLLFRVLWPLAYQRPIYSEQILDNAQLLALAEQQQTDVIWVASPAHLKRLDQAQLGSNQTGSIVKIFSSGGPLGAEAARLSETLLGQVPVEVYGSTETGGIAYRQQQDGNTAWCLLPGVEVRCQSDSRLQVRSAHVNCDHSWYSTDDSARILSEHSFELKGRLDRIVKLEEKRLSLVELEQAICNTGWVKEALCWLLPQRTQTHRQTLSATLVLSETGFNYFIQYGRAELIKQLKQSLQSQFELSVLPRKWRLVKQIPCTAQGKIDYLKIQQLMDAVCEFPNLKI